MSDLVELEQLTPVLADLGMAAPVAIVELAGGSNKLFRIDLSDGDALILKTYDELRGKLPAKEAYASGLLTGLDLPVTRYLSLAESRKRLPFRFAITNCLPGDTVGSLRQAPDVADAYHEMGRALRKLHSVALPGYVHFSDKGLANPVATNGEFVRKRAIDAFVQFRRYGGDEGLARALEARVERHFEAVTWSTGATFAHDDFHPANVLVRRDTGGRLYLSGVLDFGNAYAGDAVSDLAKTLFCCEHDAPGSTPAIREGYGPIDHPEPELALWFYTLLHRVTMWSWLRYIGVIGEGEGHALIADLEQMVEEGQPGPPVRPLAAG